MVPMRYRKRIPGLTLAAIGALGGATRQAVCQSRDPGAWLVRRVREAVTGEYLGARRGPTLWLAAAAHTASDLRARGRALLVAARSRLLAGKTRGDHAALARLLGLDPSRGQPSLLGVLVRHVERCVSLLLPLVGDDRPRALPESAILAAFEPDVLLDPL